VKINLEGVMMGELMTIDSTVGAMVENDRPEAVNRPLDIDEVIRWTPRFLEKAEVEAASRKAYEVGIAKFLKWVKAKKKTSLNHDDIKEYRDWLQSKGYEDGRDGRSREVGSPLKSGAVATYMAAVRAFYTFVGVEVKAINIAQGVKSPKMERGFKKNYLTDSQAEAVLMGIDRGTIEGRRDFALMYTLITTGLRTVEAARANIEDIEPMGGNIRLYVHGKGHAGKDDFVKLPATVEAAIRASLRDRKSTGSDAPLFASLSNRSGGRMNPQSISHIVKARLRAAGFDNAKLTAHSLRHTAITLSLLAGATIQEAQLTARHKSINTTMIYAQNIDKDKNTATQRVADMLKVA